VSELVSSFLTAHQHIKGHSVLLAPQDRLQMTAQLYFIH